MEKDLLDISGEDEESWLLYNTPNKGVTSFAGGNAGREKSYFDFSPLQIPRSSPTRPPFSSIGRVTVNKNMEHPSPCIDSGTVGKENTSGSKLELPKLSVERQQMKKKKKNAGFNLRKSLAWDRAFSTEEGVLDSTELSKITGNACLVGGDLLPAIQEEPMSASKYTSFSPGLQALEENLFNDLPVTCKKREKKIVTGTVPKYGSPSSSMAQKKVGSAQDLRSGSKRSGCPRPPPSSSLKRPANMHTTTPRSREQSVSNVSTTKSDPATVANNMKRTTQNPSKPKLSQPIQSNNSQRSLGSASFSKSTSGTKSKTRSSLASKSSIPKPSLKQSRRNVITKTSAVPSVSKSQHSIVGKSNDGPMATSDVPDFDITNMGTTLAQNSRVGNTQSTVSRLVKPSGLRLPSPSIGYFNQSGSQPSQSAEEKHSQLPRSDVCSASRFSLIPTFKKPQLSKKVPRVNSKSATGNIGSSGSAAGFSAQESVKVGLKSTRELEPKVSSCSKSSQINENLQHPCIVPGDICTTKNISTAKFDDFQSSSELPLSRRSNDDTDEQRKTCCSVEGPLIKGSMDSPVQGPSGPSGGELTQLEVRNQGKEDICTMNDFNEDLDTLDLHGKPQKECVHPGDEDEMSHILSGEKDVVVVNHSTENVAKQSEVLDSFTSDLDFRGDFASRKSDIDEISSGNQLGISVPSGPAEAPDCVQSSCNHFEESAVLDSILSGHNMECDGQDVFETKRMEVSDSTETNCEVDFVGPFPNCKDLFRESEEQHFSCQLVLEGKEGSREIDVLTRNERADTDDGPDMQIEYLTGSSAVEHNMEQVKLQMPSSAEVKMEDKSLESSHEPCSEKLTSEKHMQYNCSSVANTSDINVVCVMKQTDQLGTLDGCCPAKDVSATVFSYSNEELEDNSELEDMDLVTESDCSDEEPDGNLNLKQVNLVTKSEFIRDLDEFPTDGIPNQEYLKLEAIPKAMDQCGTPKTLLSESIGSPASIFGDPESLSQDTKFSRISEGRSREDSNSGCIEYNYVGKAEVRTDTEKDFSTQVTGQELVSHEEGKFQVIKFSRDPVEYVTREEEESEAPISMNEAFSVRDDMHPNEFTVLSDDTETSESNGVHASEKDFSAQVTDQELGSYGEVEVQVIKIFPDPAVYVTREEESGAPISMNEVFSVRDDMQPNEFTVLRDDTLTSESNEVHASEKDSSAQVTDQELGSYGEVEVQVIRTSPDPLVNVTREEESGTPITMKEAFSVRDDIQPNEDNLTSESNGVHASESSSDRTCSSEGKDKTILMDAKLEKKPDPIIVKPPDAVPFSDEWLAAIEAAGEEILTLKSGRVQHSPTDKSTPEPGPWSPVKKKNNQEIGPFDCTKYTNKGLPPALD